MPDAPVIGTSQTVELDADVFGVPFNGPLVHECVIAELAARRQGTHATRTRGMVSGGTSKPWRQKGTGRARAGTTRSPIWTGGGIVFGPHPRHYTVKVNRKARRAALRSALSVHAERGSLLLLDPGVFEAPSTKQAKSLLEGRLGAAVLVVLGDDDWAAARSFRNLPTVEVLHVDDVGVADLVRAAALVVSREAIDTLSSRAQRPERRLEAEGSDV